MIGSLKREAPCQRPHSPKKGQTVIPKPIRDHLGLKPGDTLDFLVQENGDVLIRPAVEDVRKLKGLLRRPGRAPVIVAAMARLICERGRRTR